ncbi:hypothetical protein D3C87_2078180 [compost metagenome]
MWQEAREAAGGIVVWRGGKADDERRIGNIFNNSPTAAAECFVAFVEEDNVESFVDLVDYFSPATAVTMLGGDRHGGKLCK